MSFDQPLFEAVYGLAGKSSLLDFLGVFFAEYLPYFLIVGFFMALAIDRDWKIRFYHFSVTALSVILSRGIITELIRLIYYRARPPLVLSVESLINLPNSPSFPSGHAAVFFALAFAMFAVRRRLGWWFVSGAVIVGVSRVFVGVHWPLDIVGGALIGIVSVYAVKKILPKIGLV